MNKYLLLVYFITACSDHKEAAHQEHTAEDALNLERYKNGAFIANERKISDTEITKTVIYPDKEGELMDTSCLIYINISTQKQNMTCQGLNISNVSNESESSNILEGR